MSQTIQSRSRAASDERNPSLGRDPLLQMLLRSVLDPPSREAVHPIGANASVRSPTNCSTPPIGAGTNVRTLARSGVHTTLPCSGAAHERCARNSPSSLANYRNRAACVGTMHHTRGRSDRLPSWLPLSFGCTGPHPVPFLQNEIWKHTWTTQGTGRESFYLHPAHSSLPDSGTSSVDIN